MIIITELFLNCANLKGSLYLMHASLPFYERYTSMYIFFYIKVQINSSHTYTR